MSAHSHARARASSSHTPSLARRIRGEFAEMPCLRLTLVQASRFWRVDVETCRVVFQQLVAEGFLVEGRHGYSRAKG